MDSMHNTCPSAPSAGRAGCSMHSMQTEPPIPHPLDSADPAPMIEIHSTSINNHSDLLIAK